MSVRRETSGAFAARASQDAHWRARAWRRRWHAPRRAPGIPLHGWRRALPSPRPSAPSAWRTGSPRVFGGVPTGELFPAKRPLCVRRQSEHAPRANRTLQRVGTRRRNSASAQRSRLVPAIGRKAYVDGLGLVFEAWSCGVASGHPLVPPGGWVPAPGARLPVGRPAPWPVSVKWGKPPRTRQKKSVRSNRISESWSRRISESWSRESRSPSTDHWSFCKRDWPAHHHW